MIEIIAWGVVAAVLGRATFVGFEKLAGNR